VLQGGASGGGSMILHFRVTEEDRVKGKSCHSHVLLRVLMAEKARDLKEGSLEGRVKLEKGSLVSREGSFKEMNS